MTHYVWSPVYADAMVLRQQNFNSSTSFQIMERAYVLQDANYNVTGLATWMTLLGDADGSGVVDLADYDAWSAGSGIGGPVSGDLDSDGDRDLADIDIWYTNVSEMHYGTWHVTQRMVYDAYGNFEVLAGEPNPNGTLPYGSLPADWSPHANYLAWRHFHQGLEYSAEIGWYMNRNRVYSATMGRFGQQDPMGYVDGTNLYQSYGAHPINRLDPSGLRIKSFDASFTAIQRAEITAADAAATALMVRVRADLLAFNMANFVADPGQPREPDPHDISVATKLLADMRPKLDSMITHLTGGIDALSPVCTRTWGIFGSEIYAKSRFNTDAIWFAPAFFSAAGANALLQMETVVHEMSHVALNTNDSSFESLEEMMKIAVSIMNRDALIKRFLDSAYFWEGLDNGATTPVMLNAQLLRFVFRDAGTSSKLPLTAPINPGAR